MKEIQITLGEDVGEKRKELREKQAEEERWQKEREEKKRYFKEHFRYGSTTVIKHQGESFFWGDIAHCGKENILHNARTIKAMMEQNRMTLGHMDYADPPTFYRGQFWEKEQHERRKLYQEDLYQFRGDEIVIAELIGKEPIGHIDKD
jgi:hypothetical protein